MSTIVNTVPVRLTPVDPAAAVGKVKDLLDAVQRALGVTPNMMKTMARSPAVLEGYLAFSGALAKGSLSGRVREQIALAVGQANGCEYCVSAHAALGKPLGLTDDGVTAARRGADPTDPKAAAALRLAGEVVRHKGEVTDEELTRARSAGLTDGELAEVVAAVALNVLTNYFNGLAHTEVDFPRVPLG